MVGVVVAVVVVAVETIVVDVGWGVACASGEAIVVALVVGG